MQLNQEKGGYYQGPIVRFGGSFRVDDGSVGPDVIRDGGSNMIESVVRESAGLYTVTLSDYVGPVPERLITWRADISMAAAPTKFCTAYVVVDSYSQATRSLQIQVLDLDTPAATDPDDNNMISFEIVGSISRTGTDAA